MTICSLADAGAWFNYPFLTLKERDNETGLDYFLARYYSSTQGRFTSVDPENAGADVSDPQSWNGYSYTRNTPTVLVDPDGREFRICYSNGDCHTYSDKEFDKLKADATKLGSVFKDNKIYNEVDGNVVATASFRRISADDLNDFANGVIFGRGESAGLVERAPVAGKLAFITAGVGAGIGAAIGATPAAAALILPTLSKLSVTGPSVLVTLMSKAQDPKLRNIISNLYRVTAKIGSGSSADAFRRDGSHGQKLADSIRGLENVLKKPGLSQTDRQIAEFLIRDNKNALSGK